MSIKIVVMKNKTVFSLQKLKSKLLFYKGIKVVGKKVIDILMIDFVQTYLYRFDVRYEIITKL